MKPRYQDPEENECGAACLAMLAGITLVKAKKKLYGDSDPHLLGRNDILSALADYGRIQITEDAVIISRSNMIINLEYDALVYARALRKNGKGTYAESHHWVVWDGSINAIRDPLGFTHPLKLTSYTEIR